MSTHGTMGNVRIDSSHFRLNITICKNTNTWYVCKDAAPTRKYYPSHRAPGRVSKYFSSLFNDDI